MTGTLGLFTLVDLFHLLAASSRTGRLVVKHPVGPARFYFDRGQVIHADFLNIQGEEAVFALFADEQGDFEFTLGLAPKARTIHSSLENLILEAVRRVDEARRTPISDEDLARTVVPHFADTSVSAANLTLNDTELLVLGLVNGNRDLAAIAEEARLPLDEVRLVVSRLVRIGALNSRQRKPRTARLVATLSRVPLPAGAAGVDARILEAWERVLGHTPSHVACRWPDGRVEVYEAVSLEEAGPYIQFSQDAMLRADLSANTALLVKPFSS